MTITYNSDHYREQGRWWLEARFHSSSTFGRRTGESDGITGPIAANEDTENSVLLFSLCPRLRRFPVRGTCVDVDHVLGDGEGGIHPMLASDNPNNGMFPSPCKTVGDLSHTSDVSITTLT